MDEKRRVVHTTRKLEQCSSTCAELRESLTLAQDTVSTYVYAQLHLHLFPVFLMFGESVPHMVGGPKGRCTRCDAGPVSAWNLLWAFVVIVLGDAKLLVG